MHVMFGFQMADKHSMWLASLKICPKERRTRDLKFKNSFSAVSCGKQIGPIETASPLCGGGW